MLSVILYGRNDDHGYNYHKRLAISLNCIAEVLSDPNDEVIFVDYNTSEEFPTIIEAIQDTLTPKTKALLRVLRVRPFQHARFLGQTHLPILEPVARNVGILRSRPENKWILSTNIDMVFVPEKKSRSLTQIISELEDGFYLLPRFELPENLWERFLERGNPEKNLSFIREYSRQLNLNTIVRKPGFIKYDNPGDFQLMLRKDIIEMGGFDEQMLKGWHVDSNLCKRMHLWKKTGSSLENVLKGYHCNHIHKGSFLHSQRRTQNDWGRFVNDKGISPILSQKEWGLANDQIEEISLVNSSLRVHLEASLFSLKDSSEKEDELLVEPTFYNHLVYSPLRISTYLTDHLCNISNKMNIAYVGYNGGLLCLIHSYLKKKGWDGNLFYLKNNLELDTLLPAAMAMDLNVMALEASLFIVDCGLDKNSSSGKAVLDSKEGYLLGRKKIKNVKKWFLKIVKNKSKLKENAKFIGVNAVYTDFNFVFSKHLTVHLNSPLTGICYGYLKNKRKTSLSIDQFKNSSLLNLRYFVAHYLFNYSDRIRQIAFRFKN